MGLLRGRGARLGMAGMTLPLSSSDPAAGRRKRPAHNTSVGVSHLALVVCSAIFLVPLLWAVSTSLKMPEQVFTFPPQFVPRPVLWHNYVQAWTGTVPFNLFFRNSLIITI